MAHKLDLFEMLGCLNEKDIDYFSNLPPENQKYVVPLVLQRWLTGTNDPRQVVLVNEVVNPFVFNLYKHPHLMWLLMTIVTSGIQKRYTWPSQKSKVGLTKPVAASAVKEYYKYSSADANDAVKLLSCEQVIDIAQSLGYQQDEITKIKKEFNVNGTKSNKRSVNS